MQGLLAALVASALAIEHVVSLAHLVRRGVPLPSFFLELLLFPFDGLQVGQVSVGDGAGGMAVPRLDGRREMGADRCSLTAAADGLDRRGLMQARERRWPVGARVHLRLQPLSVGLLQDPQVLLVVVQLALCQRVQLLMRHLTL